MNHKNNVGIDAFITTGKQILKADCADSVLLLFHVLSGRRCIEDAICVPSKLLYNKKNCRGRSMGRLVVKREALEKVYNIIHNIPK